MCSWSGIHGMDTMKEMDRGWTWKDEDSSSEEKCVTRIMAYSKVEKRGLLMSCAVDGLNQTVGSREKFVLRAVDQMCANNLPKHEGIRPRVL